MQAKNGSVRPRSGDTPAPGVISRIFDLKKLPPCESRAFDARICDQTFALSELPRGLPSPANCLAFLPRSPLGRLFIGFPALQFTKEAFA